jgi:hypothetical protein
MMRAFGWILVSIACSGVLLGGCNRGAAQSAAEPATVPEKAKDPEEKLYEQMRSGAFQLSSALEALQKAVVDARTLGDSSSGELKDALADIADHLDSSGASIADFTGQPPALEEFRKNFAENDDKRLKAIDKANTALMDANEADGILQSVLEKPEFKTKPELKKISDELGACLESLEGAIKALGGKLESAAGEELQPSSKKKTKS